MSTAFRRRALSVLIMAITLGAAPAAAQADPGAHTPHSAQGAAAVQSHQPIATGSGRKVG